jgi:hypothetical protein
MLLQVILLTDDAANRRKAADMGVEALGSAAYAKQRAAEQPELQDLVAAAAAAREDGEQGGSAPGEGDKGRAAKRQRVYEEHRPMSEVTAGIKAGRYHQGTLRCAALPAWYRDHHYPRERRDGLPLVPLQDVLLLPAGWGGSGGDATCGPCPAMLQLTCLCPAPPPCHPP